MAFLILVAFALGLLVDSFPRSWAHAIVETHKAIGLAILLLAVRLGWRAGHQPPRFTTITPFEARAAKLGHAGLYLLMLGAPLAGLIYAGLRGQSLDLGLFQISPLAAPLARSVTRPIREAHEWLAYGLIGLSALHVLAALWHHMVRRDDTLRRMLRTR